MNFKNIEEYLIDRFKFTCIDLIDKGWSGDRKYCAHQADGAKVLLRVSSADQHAEKKEEFKMMKAVAALGVPMCLPLYFESREGFVFSIQSWVNGIEAEEALPKIQCAEQYALGCRAGGLLTKMHSIPAPRSQPDWEARFNRKIDKKIAGYQTCAIKFDGGEKMIAYINSNRHLLKNRLQTFQHGDYHIGNMMIDGRGKLIVIDFNRCDFGDPWEEFNRIVWCAQTSPPFAKGMINGYFNDNPPIEFWRLLKLYIASNTLSSVYWAVPFGQKEVGVMLSQARDILSWYDDMAATIPSWYDQA